MTAPKLLTDAQMQRFIAHGYLCLRTELPESFHRGIYQRFDTLIGADAALNPGNNLLPAVPELNEVFADPIVRGALTSVVGPNYVMHPHRALHNNPAGLGRAAHPQGQLLGLPPPRAQPSLPLGDDHVRAAGHTARARPDRRHPRQPIPVAAPGRRADAGSGGLPRNRRVPADPLRHLASQDEELHRGQALHDEVRVHPHAGARLPKLGSHRSRLAARRTTGSEPVRCLAAAMELVARRAQPGRRGQRHRCRRPDQLRSAPTPGRHQRHRPQHRSGTHPPARARRAAARPARTHSGRCRLCDGQRRSRCGATAAGHHPNRH